MNKKIILLLSFVVIFMAFAQFAHADEYTRSYKFKPIHIDRNELLKAATEIFLYVKNINGNTIETDGYLQLGGDDYSTNLSLPLDKNADEKFPRVSYNGQLHITAYKGIISYVDFRMSDYSRELTVTGTSSDHVIGLIKVVQEKIGAYESQFGGNEFRFIMWIIFFILGIALIIVVVSLNWLHLKDRDQGIVYIVSLIVVNGVYWLPFWPKVFPGFLAGIENRSFLEKNAALFTFLGFLATILIPITAFVVRRRSYKKK